MALVILLTLFLANGVFSTIDLYTDNGLTTSYGKVPSELADLHSSIRDDLEGINGWSAGGLDFASLGHSSADLYQSPKSSGFKPGPWDTKPWRPIGPFQKSYLESESPWKPIKPLGDYLSLFNGLHGGGLLAGFPKLDYSSLTSSKGGYGGALTGFKGIPLSLPLNTASLFPKYEHVVPLSHAGPIKHGISDHHSPASLPLAVHAKHYHDDDDDDDDHHGPASLPVAIRTNHHHDEVHKEIIHDDPHHHTSGIIHDDHHEVIHNHPHHHDHIHDDHHDDHHDDIHDDHHPVHNVHEKVVHEVHADHHDDDDDHDHHHKYVHDHDDHDHDDHDHDDHDDHIKVVHRIPAPHHDRRYFRKYFNKYPHRHAVIRYDSPPPPPPPEPVKYLPPTPIKLEKPIEVKTTERVPTKGGVIRSHFELGKPQTTVSRPLTSPPPPPPPPAPREPHRIQRTHYTRSSPVRSQAPRISYQTNLEYRRPHLEVPPPPPPPPSPVENRRSYSDAGKGGSLNSYFNKYHGSAPRPRIPISQLPPPPEIIDQSKVQYDVPSSLGYLGEKSPSYDDKAPEAPKPYGKRLPLDDPLETYQERPVRVRSRGKSVSSIKSGGSRRPRPSIVFEEDPQSRQEGISDKAQRPSIRPADYAPPNYFVEGQERPPPSPSKVNLPQGHDRRYFHIYPGGVGANIHGGGLDRPRQNYGASPPKEPEYAEQVSDLEPSRKGYSQEKIDDDDNLLSSSNEESVQDLEEDMSAAEPQTSNPEDSDDNSSELNDQSDDADVLVVEEQKEEEPSQE